MEIYENFFSNQDLIKIKLFFSDQEWASQCITDANTDFSKDIPFWRKELSNEYFFSNILKNTIQRHTNKLFELLRVYAVGQTYEQYGNYHQDDTIPGTYTLVTYITEDYSENDGGYFHIKMPNGSIHAIEPIANRGILFPSTYFHKGIGFSRSCSKFRICIAWKLKEIFT